MFAMAKVRAKRISRKASSRRIHKKRRAWTSKGLSKKHASKRSYSVFISHRRDSASKVITVKAAWDAEAKVWYIEHSSLPGLHIEASTPIELYTKLPGAIEDL